jgi:pimeloyl-ACP methyl ester carboxylesterase
MAFLTRDGFRLYYEDTGGPGPTVLFLHGAGGDRKGQGSRRGRNALPAEVKAQLFECPLDPHAGSVFIQAQLYPDLLQAL